MRLELTQRQARSLSKAIGNLSMERFNGWEQNDLRTIYNQLYDLIKKEKEHGQDEL